MTLEHLGIAVADADAAAAVFEALLGAAPYKTETVEREGVRTLFFGDGGVPGDAPKLELLDALSPSSPVARFLDTRGPGLHHVAFSVNDIEAAMERLRALGFRLLADAPKPGADGKRIVFLHPKSTAGVLVELCETAPPKPYPFSHEGDEMEAAVTGPQGAPPLVLLHDEPPGTLVQRLAGAFRVYALSAAAPEALVGLLDTVGGAAGCDASGGDLLLRTAATYPERFTRLAVRAPSNGTGGAPSHPTLVFSDEGTPGAAARAEALAGALPDAGVAVLPPAHRDALAGVIGRHLLGA